MIKYAVRITDDALADMENIYNYIAYELLAPENAGRQYDRIANAILTLDSFPERFRIFDTEPEHSAYSGSSEHGFRYKLNMNSAYN